MSKLLKRAIKISITPAILMIAGKFLGILIPSWIYNLEFFVENNIEGIFSIQILYPNPSTTLFVNSLSNLSMILILAIPTTYFILKTSLYQTTLQNPRTVVKITKLNILKWITRKDTSFLQIFIWSSFLTIASCVVVVQTFQGNTYDWIGITSGVLALLSIWGSIKTFELETDKIYPTEKKYY
jgi:hypothetical protein